MLQHVTTVQNVQLCNICFGPHALMLRPENQSVQCCLSSNMLAIDFSQTEQQLIFQPLENCTTLAEESMAANG